MQHNVLYRVMVAWKYSRLQNYHCWLSAEPFELTDTAGRSHKRKGGGFCLLTTNGVMLACYSDRTLLYSGHVDAEPVSVVSAKGLSKHCQTTNTTSKCVHSHLW